MRIWLTLEYGGKLYILCVVCSVEMFDPPHEEAGVSYPTHLCYWSVNPAIEAFSGTPLPKDSCLLSLLHNHIKCSIMKGLSYSCCCIFSSPRS